MDKVQTVSAASSVERESSRRLLIGLYVVVSLLYWISLYLYLPTLPTYAQEKSDSLAVVGVILAQYGLWQAIIRLPVGIAADWLGRRKPFILGGLILSALGAWWMGTAGDAGGLIVGRAITGLACGAWVPLTVIFGSLFRPEEAVRATSILIFVGSIGRVAATSLTGSLNEMGGYPLAFFLAAGVAAVAALILLPIREQPRPVKPPSARSIGQIITRRDVLIPSLLSAVAQHATWAIPLGFVPILARGMGASGMVQSGLMSLHIGMVIAGNLGTAAIVPRIGARRLAAASFVILVGAMIGAALAQSLATLFVAQAFLGLSQGIGYPVTMGMSIEQVQDTERTTAMGLHQAVYAIGMFSGPWLAGLLADRIDIRPMFLITAAGVAILSAILMRLLPVVPVRARAA